MKQTGLTTKHTAIRLLAVERVGQYQRTSKSSWGTPSGFLGIYFSTLCIGWVYCFFFSTSVFGRPFYFLEDGIVGIPIFNAYS